MKSRTLPFFIALVSLAAVQSVVAQDLGNFPFDPYAILKSWNYDHLVKQMGEGEEIMATNKNQTYLAGLRYTSDLFSMQGKLEFDFTKDSISSIKFRQPHEVRVTSADLTGKRNPDPTVKEEYKRAIEKLDSLQKRDSISRDSVVMAISRVMGPPLSNGRTASTEKTARHSAIWINQGYSCQYKDYINYSEIVFALSTIPPWVVAEYGVPAGTEIIKKTLVSTRKMSWNASLLGFPSNEHKMRYSDFLLLLEFTTGQKYLISLPKNAISYLSKTLLLEFATGNRYWLMVPENSIGYLPTISFEDCDGDAIPEAWIQVPSDIQGNQKRHVLFSLQLKEPNLIFDSDDFFPTDISIQGNSRVIVTFQDGTTRTIESPGLITPANGITRIKPKGFRYLNSTLLNKDGSTNFVGGIELSLIPGAPGFGVLEITFKHIPGGWEIDKVEAKHSEK